MRRLSLSASAIAATLLLAPLTSTAAVGATPGEVVEIATLNGRADTAAGGDALVEITVPASADASALLVDLGGRDITQAFAVRSDGRFTGLVEGLALGDNTVRAELPDGRGATLRINAHPHEGPVFSGPHLLPWGCVGESVDVHCNRSPSFAFSYISSDPTVTGFQAYDPESPASDVAMTTTDEGNEVPFIVRQETGVIARDEYRIAVLYDPNADWTPTEPQQAWNSKLVLTHGASCDTSYAMGSAPAVMLEEPLGAGFAVGSHALDNAGHNCNIATQAESLVMLKEYLVDSYGGPIRYTIGSGCSGGALAQQQVANAYPGVYQGITPACSFADAWSTAQQYIDYYVLRQYFENPTRWAIPWEVNSINSVYGHINPVNPITFTEVIPNSGEPTRSCPGVATADVYDETSNPTGVRCTLQDYMVNIFGRNPETGWANRPLDNIGVMYGMRGLLDGSVLPAQFVDVNVKAGGLTMDLDHAPDRTDFPAEREGLEMLYRSGASNQANNMDEVAIIDLRGPDPGAFHDVYRTYVLRDRLLREHGTADNQVLWRGTVPLFGDATYVNDAIFAMDGWLAAVEADTRDVPLAQKLLDNRNVDERCTNGAGVDSPAATCDAVVTAYSSPRIFAGMPSTDDVQKCQLEPLVRDEIDATFTDAQWASLEATFPTGVCDYSVPGVEQQATVGWMTYEDGEGLGRPMGPAPVSVPYGALAAAPAAPAGPTVPLPTTGGGLAVLAGVVLAGAEGLRRRMVRAG